ncbi:CBS domain-containing protein [Streptomyces sp. ID05-39B]|uniref:CBS domain-containing protein n=1 Tax=Streptomyces sp. ID05-39B TaxID=3028664 RepID=UPI0029AAA797|nr:CBS domain-containing protein [Streptomyces sp. ID05-39B]MDX3527764.1 CBS domain-containing protein [Streptomyces sp. ID05-39B]
MVKKTDEEFVRDLMIAGAPLNADPDAVAAAALEIAKASTKGPPTTDAIMAIAAKYPQLGERRVSHPQPANHAAKRSLTARDIMIPRTARLAPTDSLRDAAQTMRDLGMGALPVCDEGGKLVGMITDRDIVVHASAVGLDPAKVEVGKVTQETAWVDADEDLVKVLETMETNRIHLLPVLDNAHHLVGMVTEHRLAAVIDRDQLAEYVQHEYDAEAGSHLG